MSKIDPIVKQPITKEFDGRDTQTLFTKINSSHYSEEEIEE